MPDPAVSADIAGDFKREHFVFSHVNAINPKNASKTQRLISGFASNIKSMKLAFEFASKKRRILYRPQ
jgi:hypothetical protein